MRTGDLFVPNFRQHGVFLARGMPLDTAIIYWRGFEEGNYIPKEVGGFPVCVPVGSQMLHAAGIAFAQKYNKTGAAVVVYVGDGGTSEGDFYEALNFAGVFKVPLITDNREQPVGHIGAEEDADGRGDACPEGDRRGNQMRAGRRQRRHRGLQGGEARR